MSPTKRHPQAQAPEGASTKLIAFVLAAALMLLAAGSFAFIKYAQNDALSVAQRTSSYAPKTSFSTGDSPFFAQGSAPTSPASYSLTLTFVGDCTLGTDEAFGYATGLPAYYDEEGPDYFLEGVRPLFEADDLTIVNMEGTFTHESAREYKEFAFKAPPEYASILSGSSVELANLANNHSSDYGQQSYHDTIDALEGAGIRSFGYERTQVLEVNGVKVGFVGSYALAGEWYAAEILSEGIEQVKQQGAQVIIVTVHWGEEKHYYPSSSQVSLAHLAIDEGADLVVGHHPHVFQGQETYQGKQIIYSLGNFCFGGNRNPYDMDAIIYQQTFTLDAGQIKTYDDYQIIPCSTSSREDYNDYRPRILEGSEGERVLAKYHELRVD